MKPNRNGRGKSPDRFFAAHHYLIASPAFQRLSATAQAAWLHFGVLFNGVNNGHLAMSSRRLGEALNVSRDTASRAVLELVNSGFLEITAASSFSCKRKAAEYRLTHLKCDRNGALPSRAFQNIGKATQVIEFKRR